MTDRELLEMAAKAVGRPVWAWNPLDDDGDALRLAVKLNLDITFGWQDSDTAVFVNADWDGAPAEVMHEFLDRDAYAATRRAIVRAAAEIGREMK